MAKKNTIKLILIGCLIILFLAGLVVELPFSMNYLQVRSFWKTSLLLGIILGLVVAAGLVWRQRQQLTDSVARMQLFSAVFISLLLSTPLFISWINHAGLTNASTTAPTAVIFESEQARFSSRFGSSRLQKPQANQYLFFFYRDGQLYRLQDDEPFFPDAEAGDTLYLDIVRGRLGYEWVIK